MENFKLMYILDAQIEITLKDSTDEGEEIKKFLHTKGKDTIREKLKKYVSSLKKEFAKGMIRLTCSRATASIQ